MSKIISETFYGSRREPRWLLESPKEQQSHFDQRGCVRQIKSSSHPISHPIRHTENDLQLTRSRASYFSEQPSIMTADHRQAHVYNNAVPATHRTVDRSQLNTSNTSFNIPIVEFMVPLCCGKCEEKVKEELENDDGVYRVVCDLHNQRVTVSSNLDPQRLLRRIKRIKKNSHFWRGSTYLKDAHYLATHKPSHQSQVVLPERRSHHVETPAHRREPTRSSQMLSQNPRYAAPRSSSSYDGQFQKRNAVARDDPEYYYAGAAEYQYETSSSPNYNTSFDAHVYDHTTAGSAYTAVPVPINDSLHHHLPSSYGLAYEAEDYPLHLTEYY